MVLLRQLSYGKALAVFCLSTLLEPAFELGFSFIHNFVFQQIAGISFGSISLSGLLLFISGHLSALINLSWLGQYVIMLPFAALLGIFLANFRLFGPVSLLRTLQAALLLWLILSALILFTSYDRFNWYEIIVFLSYSLSMIYYFLAVILSWIILRRAGLL